MANPLTTFTDAVTGKTTANRIARAELSALTPRPTTAPVVAPKPAPVGGTSYSRQAAERKRQKALKQANKIAVERARQKAAGQAADNAAALRAQAANKS